MKKLFISQPMRDKTDEEIKTERENIKSRKKQGYQRKSNSKKNRWTTTYKRNWKYF